MIDEQADIRKIVEELANRLDQPQPASNTVQSETSTNVLLEISDLKTKVLRLTEQSTKHDGDFSFLAKLSEQVELPSSKKLLPGGLFLGGNYLNSGNALPDLIN